MASPYRPVPLANKKKLSAHLQSLREENKIEDVDRNDHCPWISNVVFTEKKQKGQIRMNIDMREANKALHRTKRHVETIQEIRHKLHGATRFSEMDMGTTRLTWQKIQGILAHSKLTKGYTDSKSCSLGFPRYRIIPRQSQGCTNRPARMHFHPQQHFGMGSDTRGARSKPGCPPYPPRGERSHPLKKKMHVQPGCTSIHDNILVWGRTSEEHEANLDACLTRQEEKGLTLRREKCTFGATSMSRFGTIFSKSGMSADPKKNKAIKEAGPPQNADEVKSFLQACHFNARFMFNTEKAYAQITKPLRDLTRKNTKFLWTAKCQQAYKEILQTMITKTIRPHTKSHSHN